VRDRAVPIPSRALPRVLPRVLPWGVAAAALLLALLAALGTGRFPVGLGDLLLLALGRGDALPDAARTVLWNLRLPRILAALLVGAALAGAGAAFQAMFRNPLASPDLLGVSAGASLGAVAGIVLDLPVAGVQLLAFGGGLAAVGAVLGVAGLAGRRGDDPVLVLVLAGIALGALLGAGIAMLKVFADPYSQLPAITFWLLGSLAGAARADILAAALAAVPALVVLLLLRWRLNLLTLGEDEARALGVSTAWLRLAAILAATFATAACTALAGSVGWVGLVVPHAARLLGGADLRRSLPLAMLLGAAFLLGVDTLARSAARVEIPLGVLTAVLGTPLFLWLLAARGRGR